MRTMAHLVVSSALAEKVHGEVRLASLDEDVCQQQPALLKLLRLLQPRKLRSEGTHRVWVPHPPRKRQG